MKNKLSWGLVLAGLFLSHIACYGLGLLVQDIHYKSLPPKETLIIREVPKYTTITLIDRQVEVEKVLIKPRYFTSLEELQAWLRIDNTNNTVFGDYLGNTANQCEDYAISLMENALTDGYILSTETLYPAEYYQLYQSSMPEGFCHMVNLAIIGNDSFIIDPITDQIWYWHPLD